MIQEIININEKDFFGILLQNNKPIDSLIIFLNAGAVYRTGSNRLHVKLAYSLANKGYPSFRFDFSGIGENLFSSDDNSFVDYQERETIMVMDFFQQKFNINKFVLFGMCSGAKVAFNVAQNDNRVTKLILTNGFYLDKIDEFLYTKALNYIDILYYKRNLFDINRWLKVLKGESNFFKNIHSKIKDQNKEKNISSTIDYSVEKWKIFIERNVKVYLIFSEGSWCWGIYKLAIKSKLENEFFIQPTLVKNTDHVFTSYASQKKLIGLVINQLQ